MSRPARLLSLNSYHYKRGGSDAVYFEHDELFSKNGWDTAFFSMHHEKNLPSPWSRYFIDELEFGSSYSPVQKIKMAGKVIYSFEARNKLNKLINDWRPDIAHAHCIYHHLSPSVLGVLKDQGIPTVMTAHDLKVACPAYKMLNSSGICERCKNGNLTHMLKYRCIHQSLSTSGLVMIESAVQKALHLYRNNLDKIITPSKFYRNKLIEWGWSPDQLVYIPNYVRPGEYRPEYSAGEYFFYFGRLAPEKGLETLIKASLETGAELLIAGTGPDEDKLRGLVPENNDKIRFLGFCSGEKLHDLIRGARCVILPSEWYENAPISLLEAYACGKIVIGARIGGIPEMMEEGATGFLFDSGDQSELENTINHVSALSNSEIADMGRHARDYVSDNYTPEIYVDKMTALYNDLGVKPMGSKN